MTSHLRTYLSLPLLACALLPGCLTRALWEESPESSTLVEERVDCEVREVRGSLLRPPSQGEFHGESHGEVERIQIEFSARPTAHTSIQLRGLDGGQTRKLLLRPRAKEGGSWRHQAGAEIFRPLAWGFRLYRGSYFQEERVRARIAMEGLLRPEQIGALVGEEDLAKACHTMPALAIPEHGRNLRQRCLRGFVANRWMQILSPPGEKAPPCTQEALVFLGPDGEDLDPVDLEECSSASATPEDKRFLASCCLLGRLTGPWGKTRFVYIGLPILLHGQELRLERLGPMVCWQRSQIWLGNSVDAAVASLDEAGLCSQLPAIELPLMTRSFTYTHAREDTGVSVLPTFLKILATPPALALDFVGTHFVAYEEFMRWLLLEQKTFHGPVPPTRK